MEGFPDRRGKLVISTGGGEDPVWRTDGKELFWRSSTDNLTSVAIELKREEVVFGKPQPLFKLGPRFIRPPRDGRRFLVLEPDGPPQPDPPMVVMQHWAAKLSK